MASNTEDLDTYVETRMIPVKELHRYPGNARRGNVAELRKSLRRHGQYRALIVQDRTADGEGFRVLAGNHTFDALVAEGRREVRCEVHVMDDDLARRVNVADNRQAALGYDDADALVELLSYMDGDYDGLGYTDDDVQKLIEPPHFPDDDDEDEGGGGESKGLGEAVVAYNIVFDNEVQQSRFYEWMRWLRRQYPDLETLGERVHAYLGGLDLG